jgi:hypothetical protein
MPPTPAGLSPFEAEHPANAHAPTAKTANAKRCPLVTKLPLSFSVSPTIPGQRPRAARHRARILRRVGVPSESPCIAGGDRRGRPRRSAVATDPRAVRPGRFCVRWAPACDWLVTEVDRGDGGDAVGSGIVEGEVLDPFGIGANGSGGSTRCAALACASEARLHPRTMRAPPKFPPRLQRGPRPTRNYSVHAASPRSRPRCGFAAVRGA